MFHRETVSLSRSVPRLFLAILIPLLLLAAFLVILRFDAEYNREVAHIQSQQEIQLQLRFREVQTVLDLIKRDIFILRGHHELQEILHQSDASTSAWGNLTREFHAFLDVQPMYDQIRLLNRDGIEVLRVNMTESGPVVVPADQLQDRSSRYYFIEAMKLPEGALYMTTLDLNVERGALEIPYKPMIRFAVPLFGSDGTRWGILVLNFRASLLLERFTRNDMAASSSRFLVADPGGYWLGGPEPEQDWGAFVPERAGYDVRASFPATADAIYSTVNGKVDSQDGIFSYASFFPFIERETVFNDAVPQPFTSNVEQDPARYFWKLIAWHPPAAMATSMREIRRDIAVQTTLLLAPLVGLAWLFSAAYVKRRSAEDEMRRMAQYDALTHLPNRAMVMDRLDVAIRHAQADSRGLSLMFIDLDGFKPINDRYGHAVGDKVLVTVAQRLQAAVFRLDTVARLGGDEFLILLERTARRENLAIAAEKVRSVVLRPIEMDGRQVELSVSIGIAVYPLDGDTVSALLEAADSAMYRAKNTGKNRYVFFNDSEPPQ